MLHLNNGSIIHMQHIEGYSNKRAVGSGLSNVNFWIWVEDTQYNIKLIPIIIKKQKPCILANTLIRIFLFLRIHPNSFP